MIRRPIEDQIVGSIKAVLATLGASTEGDVKLEIPRQKGFGDLSSNVAMIHATEMGMKPRDLAEKIIERFSATADGVEKVEIAGPGFINFHLSNDYFHTLLAEILADPERFGSSDEGKGAKWNFEFVSANPTGPLNVVSARAASIGAALVNIFRKRGFDARSEYYFNDAGRQVRLLGASVKARYHQIIENLETAVIPEDGYHGEYVRDIAQAWIEAHQSIAQDHVAPTLHHISTDYLVKNTTDEQIGNWASDWMLTQQRTQLERFRVVFDLWYKEGALHNSGKVSTVVAKMRNTGDAYEKDGALWFKSSEFGDTDDRVMVTSEGRPTYRVPDMAYHIDKFERGFEKAVVLLGPDHHGAIITLTAALKALGLPDGFYIGTIVQQVNLMRDGEPVKMSKRAGQMVTLDELVDEVGVDAARYFFLRRKISTPLDFDIELAKKNSDENPVFYVQYAHARVCSILRQPGAEGLGANATAHYPLLSSAEELDMIRALALYPLTLSSIVRSLEPSLMTTYLADVSKAFHHFYQKHRVITDDKILTAARLDLCRAVASVLKNGLALIGVEAPEKM